jgi:uncharacterized protein (UPF0333 family)
MTPLHAILALLLLVGAVLLAAGCAGEPYLKGSYCSSL